MSDDPSFAPSCPWTDESDATIRLAHGGGGRLMQQLLRDGVLPALGRSLLQEHDAAVVDAGDRRLAFTTDSYVARPRFFPGGDIGTLAVNGTLNDLAVAGARPRWLSAALIVEEGLPREELLRILASMRSAAEAAGVAIVTGDTKVVERGAGDGLYINTAGIGLVDAGIDIHPRRVRLGDVVIVSGDLGRHGVAIMAAREGLDFAPPIASDCACLAGLVQSLLDAGLQPHCLRDVTRGGLAAVLNEIAQSAALSIEIDEAAIPIDAGVAAACELLGLDPLQVACEGRLVAFADPAQAAAIEARMQAHPLGAQARIVGCVGAEGGGRVFLRNGLGARRIVDLPAGELLPRIC